jgi:GT2 family glycosyltransferase
LNRVSVIIPSWNGQDLLGPCLDSLYRQHFQDFDVILVDNGSSDGSVPFVEQNFPQVTVIRLGENRGFSAAVNAGIAACSCPYVCLLNNDTEVDARWLGELIAALDQNPDAGSLASKILFYGDQQTVNSAGDEFSFFGVAYQRRWKRGDTDLFSQKRYVFSACAAAALYRREIFDRIGLFDEFFFAYQEDVDFGFRAQLAGYRCLFVPGAVVYHKYHQTSSRIADYCFYLKERNKYFVLIKNLPAKFFLLCLPLFLSYEALAFLQAIRFRHVHGYFRARRDALRCLPRFLKDRRRIQNQRRAGDAYLFKTIRFCEPILILFYRPLRAFACRFRSLIGRESAIAISDRMEN